MIWKARDIMNFKNLLAMVAVLLICLSAFGCKTQDKPENSEPKTSDSTAGTTISDSTSTVSEETSGSQDNTQTTTNRNATTNTTKKITTTPQGGWQPGGESTGKKLFDKRSGVKGQVVLFIPWDTSGDANFQKVIDGFTKEYPGTKIKIVYGEWTTRDIKLTQLIRSGSSPDYVPTINGDFPRRAIKNMLMPLDDMIQITDLLDTYTMDNITSWQGKKYAIIGKRSPAVLYYNTTMLKNAAIVDTPYKLYLQDKWTWTELKNMARKLTVDKNNDGKPDVYGFGTELDFVFPLAQGRDIIKITNGTPKLNIDDEVWRSSLLFYYDGINKDKIFSPVRWSLWEEFVNGNVAMYYGLSGDAEKLINKGMKNWEIAPFPKAKSTDKNYIGYSSSDGFGIATGAKNPIGGIAFGEYQYNYYAKLSESNPNKLFTKEQTEMMNKLENRITWLYGYGMEDSFCQSFGNYMRKNGDFTALLEEMRPIWQKNLDDTLKGR